MARPRCTSSDDAYCAVRAAAAHQCTLRPIFLRILSVQPSTTFVLRITCPAACSPNHSQLPTTNTTTRPTSPSHQHILSSSRQVITLLLIPLHLLDRLFDSRCHRIYFTGLGHSFIPRTAFIALDQLRFTQNGGKHEFAAAALPDHLAKQSAAV